MKKIIFGLLVMTSASAFAGNADPMEQLQVRVNREAEILGAKLESIDATVTLTRVYDASQLMIDGMPISARKHWNVQQNPSFNFCRSQGFDEQDGDQTIIEETRPQKMNFFWGNPVSLSNADIAIRSEENSKLVKVVCLKMIDVSSDP